VLHSSEVRQNGNAVTNREEQNEPDIAAPDKFAER